MSIYQRQSMPKCALDSKSIPFKALLLDIEGTTTSISFVKDVLFPYAKENAATFIKANHASKPVRAVLDSIIELSNEQAATDSSIKPISNADDFDTIVENVITWIDKDAKLSPLKELQGQMWVDGYKQKAYEAHVYDDTATLFKACNASCIPLYIYSSGSIYAQKLLFEHTIKGDLTPYISDYYDTTFGPKVDIRSYVKIAVHTGLLTSGFMFITDSEKEAYAAEDAGMLVRVAIREGNPPLSEEAKAHFTCIHSFDEIGLSFERS